MIKFPQKGTPIVQAPKGNLQGSLWSTFNIDLTGNPGRVRLGRKLNVVYSSSDDADIDSAPYAFAFFSGEWYGLAGNKIFYVGSDQSVAGQWAEASGTGIPTDCNSDDSDIAVFDSRIWVASPGSLYSSNGSGNTWTVRDTFSSSTHILKTLESTDRLYYTTTNSSSVEVRSIDKSNTTAESAGSYFIEFQDQPYGETDATAMAAYNGKLYISLMAYGNSGSVGRQYGIIYEWDGISSQATAMYRTDSSGVRAFAVGENALYAFDSAGRFLKFNGYGFDEIARLPYNESKGTRATDNSGSEQSFNMHRNGLIVTSRGTLLGLVNGRKETGTNYTEIENVPSGIWEVNLSTGSCNHKHSFTSKSFFNSTITDFGHSRLDSVGALAEQTVNGLSDTDTNTGTTTLLAGGNIFVTNTSTKLTAFFALSGIDPVTDYEGQKRGYFVTTWIDSDNMQDVWSKIGIKHREYIDSSDKIVVKYRTRDTNPTYNVLITWTSTTTFTTTTDISSYWTSGTGGEVEIVNGKGAGTIAHITSIVNNAGTYTVTIDEEATGVVNTNTATARFQSWTKIAALTQQNIESEINAIGAASERIQLKVVMHFTGDGEFHEMQLVNKPHIQLE